MYTVLTTTNFPSIECGDEHISSAKNYVLAVVTKWLLGIQTEAVDALTTKKPLFASAQFFGQNY